MSRVSWKARAFLSETSSRPLAIALISILVAMVTGLFASMIYEVDYRVTCEGEVVSRGGEKEIQARREGVINIGSLKVGQSVKAGDAIATLEIPFTTHEAVKKLLSQLQEMADSSDPSAKLVTQLSNNNPFLSDVLQKAKQAAEVYASALEARGRLLRLKLTNIEIQKNKLRKRIAVLQGSKSRKLTEGLVEDQKREIASLNEEKLHLESESDQKISAAKSFFQASLKDAFLRGQEYFELFQVRAFSDGKVSKILVTSSQQVSKDQSIAVLNPEGNSFEARLRVATFDIGHLGEKQRVQAEVDAFPYQKFGLFMGEISKIDQTITMHQNNSWYYAYSSIERPSSPGMESVQLLPGMKVKAYVLTRRVTLIRLIYEKLFLPYTI